jgi:hypothetical protein
MAVFTEFTAISEAFCEAGSTQRGDFSTDLQNRLPDLFDRYSSFTLVRFTDIEKMVQTRANFMCE